jgi:Tfp pilus assembly protein PilO
MTRDRKLLFIVGLMALIAVWFVGVWMPNSRDLADAHAATESAEIRAQELEVEIARLAAADKDEDATEALTERVTEAVPDTADLAGLLTAVAATADEAGVRLLGVTPGALVAGSPTALPLSLDVSGGYFSVVSFTQKVAALPRLVVIDGVQISAGSAGELTVKYTARAFTVQAPASAAPTTTTTPSSSAPLTAVAK